MDAGANLALDLHRDLDQVALGLLGVKLWPGLVVDGAGKAQRLVEEFLGPVRADGGQHGHDVVGNAPGQGGVALVLGDVVHILGRRVHELHRRGDCRVELAAVKVVRALDAQLVEGAVELCVCTGEFCGIDLSPLGAVREQPHHTPGALDEAVGARDGLGVPVEVLLGRSHEENGQTHGVRTVGVDHTGGRNDVALRLGHGVAMLVLDHALAEQVGEGLVLVDHAHVAQDLGPEARVEQVENCVLDAADVVVDGHPAVHRLLGEGGLVVVGVDVAQVVPAGAREGVHGVGDALGRLAALGAGGLVELGALGERLAGAEVEVVRQAHRELILGHGHVAAAVAVNHGDGVAPVALAADEPVAQAELDLGAAATVLLEPGDDGVDGLGVLAALHARELAGLDEVALGRHGLVPVDVGHAQLALVLELVVEGVFLLADDGRDGQAVLAREVEVALVAAGDAHDGAGAVVEKDVVGHPQRGGLAGHGVDNIATGEDTVLLARGTLAVD